jgi:general stress protein 26
MKPLKNSIQPNEPAICDEVYSRIAKFVLSEKVCNIAGHTHNGEFIARPLYTAHADGKGNIYFFISSAMQEIKDILQEDYVYLLYSFRSQHLKIKGRATILADKNDCLEQYWNPYLSIYFPEGPRKLQLLQVNIIEAVLWSDHHATSETLIAEKQQDESLNDTREPASLKLLLNRAS